MPFIFLLLFASFSWSGIGTCGEPCVGSSVLGGDVSNTGGLCFTSGAVSARYDNLVHACEVKGLYNGYCICIAATYCPGYYMIRGACESSPPPPQLSSSSASSPPLPELSSSAIVVVPPFFSSSSDGSSGNGNDFDFNEVKRGFSDFNDIFVLIFACFLLVKLIWMAK